jgi:hypothetical protein
MGEKPDLSVSVQSMAKNYYSLCILSDSLLFYRFVNQERMRIAGLDANKGSKCKTKHVIALMNKDDEVFLLVYLAASTAQL